MEGDNIQVVRVRAGNQNPKNPTLILSVPKQVREELQLKDGDKMVWKRNEKERWEVFKLEWRD